MAYAKKTNEALTVEVLDEVAILSETEKAKKMFAFVKWGDNSPKLEVRGWYKRADGTTKANSGVTLTVEECMALRDALNGIDFTKYAPEKKASTAASKAKEPTAKKTTARKTTAKKATPAKATTKVASKEKEPTVKAKEPETPAMSKDDMIAECLKLMSMMADFAK